MKTDLRKSGIEFIDDIPWGTHFCQFYQSRQDLIEMLVPYFKQGLEDNEFCMWVTAEPLGVDGAKAALKEKVKNLDDYIKKGQIEILDYSQWYTKTGKFDADTVIKGWTEKEKQAVERGFDGLRLTGNTLWLEKKDWNSFIDYEAIVDSVIRQHRMLAVCSYSLDRCQADEVIDVVNNHKFACIKRRGKWMFLESSARKKAEEAVKKSEEYFRAVIENSSDIIIIVDKKGIVKYISPSIERFAGYKQAEIIGKSTFDFIHPADLPRATVDFAKALITKETDIPNSFRVRHKDGSERILEGRGKNLLDNPAVKGFVMNVSDITERKQAEEALRASEAKYRLLAENLPQKIFIKDRNLAYIFCNKNYARDLKIETEEIKGKTDYDFYPKELAEKYRSDDKEVMEKGEITDIEEKYLQDGKEFFVHTVKAPAKDKRGNVIGILGIFWDITERKKMEEKERKHLQELEVFYKASVGREERIIELKKEVEQLKKELGK